MAPDALAGAGATVPTPWTIGEDLERILQIDLEVVGGYVIEGTTEEPLGGSLQPRSRTTFT